MTRIIAGNWGGRRLATPPGDRTRPTTDRVREALYSSLASALGSFDSVRVLDLFAGSGALGLEALSRGAQWCDFVDSDQRAVTAVRRNIAALGTTDAQVHRKSAQRYVQTAPARPYDLVFLDPPYSVESMELQSLISQISIGAWRTPDSIVVVERSSRGQFSWPKDVSAVRDRRYGETHLWYGR